jgi:hypothetical protein
MKCRLVFIVASMFLLSSQTIFAQQGSADSSADIAFWVDHWSRPKLALFGPEEEAFNNNVHQITFAWDDSNDATDPGVLDANVRWLKDHPNVRFYVEGYASSRGELVFNLALSQRRADRVGRGMGTVVSGLRRTQRSMLEQEPDRPLLVLSILKEGKVLLSGVLKLKVTKGPCARRRRFETGIRIFGALASALRPQQPGDLRAVHL